MNKTLSLCIIAKDAEKGLKNCLESVNGLVDEIILIDTGSIDNTKRIASNFNAKIFDYTWQENFSEVRNFSLSKVTTDWVLILDTDEVLVDKHSKIKEIINKDYDKTPMFFVDIFTYINPENDEYSLYQKKIRLFPKNNNIRFEHSIGEEIIHPEGIYNLESHDAKGIVIKHFLDGGLKSKSPRNVPILKKELKKNPKAFYYNYLMGKECLQHGLLEKAFTSYQNALSSTDEKDSVYLSEICTDIIKILYKQGNREEALN
ncbi:MAG: glycosyltransferase family 2 protein [Candidatus Sericytochromatia bacterium]